MVRFVLLFSLLLFASLGVGCAHWKEEPSADPVLATPSPPPTASVIDIAFVTLPVREESVDWHLWNEVDEQVLPDALRLELASNGLRVGRIGNDLPDVLTGALQDGVSGEPLQFLDQANLLSDVEAGSRRIYCRNTIRYELPVRKPMRGNISVLMKQADSVVGRRFSDPQFLFSMETRQGDDGEVILRLVPEIQHGNLKQSWVSNDQALRMESRRDVEAMEWLAMEFPLTTGQAVLVSPTPDARGLGAKMLTGERADERKEVVALVVRLSSEPENAVDY